MNKYKEVIILMLKGAIIGVLITIIASIVSFAIDYIWFDIRNSYVAIEDCIELEQEGVFECSLNVEGN